MYKDLILITGSHWQVHQ